MRNGWLEVLKLLLAIAVIGLHSAVLTESYPTLSYFLCNGLFRAAVPLFFIMSGYFLPRDADNTKAYSWIKRILLLYAVWTIIYLPVYITQIPPTAVGLFRFTKLIVFGYGHLWYLIALAIAGFIAIKAKGLGARTNLLLAGFLYCVGCAILYFLLSVSAETPPLYYNRNAILFGLPFVLAGYYYDELEPYFSRYRYPVLILGSLVFLLEISWVRHFAAGRSFDMYFSLIVLCPAIFGWVKSLKPIESGQRLGKFALALYLIHPFFIIYGEDWGVGFGSALFVFSLLLSAMLSLPLVVLSRYIRFVL